MLRICTQITLYIATILLKQHCGWYWIYMYMYVIRISLLPTPKPRYWLEAKRLASGLSDSTARVSGLSDSSVRVSGLSHYSLRISGLCGPWVFSLSVVHSRMLKSTRQRAFRSPTDAELSHWKAFKIWERFQVLWCFTCNMSVNILVAKLLSLLYI